MSSELNKLYHKTSYALLRTPEFFRYFDSKFVGGLYRILCSKIYRRGVDSLKFYNEAGSLSKLASCYDAGGLCTYFTAEKLEEITEYKASSIYAAITQLKEAKLLKVEKFGDGWIFELGKRLSITSSDGYGVGQEHEGMYMDEWFYLAQSDGTESEDLKVLEFRKRLAISFGSQKSGSEVIKGLQERIDAQKVSQNSKILEKPFQNFGKISVDQLPGGVRAGQVSLFPELASIEENNIEVHSKESLQEKMLLEALVKIGNSPSLKAATNVLREVRLKGDFKNPEAIEKNLIAALEKRSVQLDIPVRFPGKPLFNWSFEVARRNPSKTSIAAAVYNLIAESTNKRYAPTGSNYKKLVSVLETVILRYTPAQVIWTLGIIEKYSVESLTRLAKNPLEISTLTNKYADDYARYLKEKRLEELPATPHASQEKTSTLVSGEDEPIVNTLFFAG